MMDDDADDARSVEDALEECVVATDALLRSDYHNASVPFVETLAGVRAESEEARGMVSRLGEQLLELSHQLERKFAESEKIAAVTDKINEGFLLPDVMNNVFESFQTILPYDR